MERKLSLMLKHSLQPLFRLEVRPKWSWSSLIIYLADTIFESLLLATSGPLEGKYMYYKVRHIVGEYFKKCSSVLGLSVIAGPCELLISDKLNPEVLINPSGAYEAFKKGCTTVCKGQEVGVWFYLTWMKYFQTNPVSLNTLFFVKNCNFYIETRFSLQLF